MSNVFDEYMANYLDSFILFINVRIVECIKDDQEFLPELFKELADPGTPIEQLADFVRVPTSIEWGEAGGRARERWRWGERKRERERERERDGVEDKGR